MDKLQLWGGVECTVNRVGNDYFDQLERNGHATREGDIARFAALGLRALRQPVLWERIAPHGLREADWRWADRQLAALRLARIEPIVGLVHHGSGPRDTNLLDPAFANRLAGYAAAVARRYPWITHYTPVNEPLTTARFAALYGAWYPHARGDRSFVAALLNQVVATVLAMQAVRRVNPAARLVQTEDLGKTHATEPLQDVAHFYNQRRWLSWDLLCGHVGPDHPLHRYLLGHGADPSQLAWLQAHPCPPDLLGANYYVTGERWLDHRLARYPARYRGEAAGRPLVDIECPRAAEAPPIGLGALLREAWQRYGLPIAVTEAHIDAHREDQLRWLLEVWRAGEAARAAGIDLRAVTVWALLGSFDWHCLVTRREGRYEPGPFDLRGGPPRATALAELMRELAAGRRPSHPVLDAPGWWRRPGRWFCSTEVEPANVAHLDEHRAARADARAGPLLVLGDGALLRTLLQCCRERHVAALHLPAPPTAAALDRRLRAGPQRPWALVQQAGDTADAGWAARGALPGLHVTCIATDAAAARRPPGAGESLRVDASRLEAASEADLAAPLHQLLDLIVDRQAGRIVLGGGQAGACTLQAAEPPVAGVAPRAADAPAARR